MGCTQSQHRRSRKRNARKAKTPLETGMPTSKNSRSFRTTSASLTKEKIPCEEVSGKASSKTVESKGEQKAEDNTTIVKGNQVDASSKNLLQKNKTEESNTPAEENEEARTENERSRTDSSSTISHLSEAESKEGENDEGDDNVVVYKAVKKAASHHHRRILVNNGRNSKSSQPERVETESKEEPSVEEIRAVKIKERQAKVETGDLGSVKARQEKIMNSLSQKSSVSQSYKNDRLKKMKAEIGERQSSSDLKAYWNTQAEINAQVVLKKGF